MLVLGLPHDLGPRAAPGAGVAGAGAATTGAGALCATTAMASTRAVEPGLSCGGSLRHIAAGFAGSGAYQVITKLPRYRNK